MKIILSTACFLISLLTFTATFQSSAQDVTGIWKGYFISDDGEQYKLEFQVAQEPSLAVSGVSYSYLDVRFYGKASMTGTFLKTTATFRIREIKTIEVKSTLSGGTCIMNYDLTYSKSGKEEFLEGTYLGKFESKTIESIPSKWGDCGGGTVFLRKVPVSDFYVEPFLKGKIKNIPVYDNVGPVKKNAPTIVKKPIAKTKAPTTPVKKDIAKIKTVTPLVKKQAPVVIDIPPQRPTIKKTNVPIAKTKIDSIQKGQTQIKPSNQKTVIEKLPAFQNRENELVKTLVVTNPNVTVKLYDNGEIDNDSISVYLDKKLVIASKRLTASPLTITLKMEKDNDVHELIMVAENLGTIPPNTSLMIVESGEQRFTVRITSTEQKNAVVRFKYQASN
jgi:hypothetical protein